MINAIYASINGNQYVSFQIGEEKPRGFSSIEEFISHAKAGYQSVTDLIKRRNEIKAKLILANATTEIVVGKDRMTIAEAIDKKEAIAYNHSLLNELKRQLSNVNQHIEKESYDMERRLDKRLEAEIGSKDRKQYANEVEDITNNFVKRYRPVIIDPLSIRDEIKKLESELNEFTIEIDSVLSEANAVTTIEIEG